MVDLPLPEKIDSFMIACNGKTFYRTRIEEALAYRYNLHKRLVEMLDIFVGCEEGETVTSLYKKEAKQLLKEAQE